MIYNYLPFNNPINNYTEYPCRLSHKDVTLYIKSCLKTGAGVMHIENCVRGMTFNCLFIFTPC